MRKAPLSEKDWRNTVVDLAERLGWRCFYVDQSTRYSEAAGRRVRNINVRGQGFPDLVLVRGRDARLVFAELKRDLGPRGGGEDQHVNPTDEQKAWLADLEAAAHKNDGCGLHPAFEVHLWRPADYDAIAVTLR